MKIRRHITSVLLVLGACALGVYAWVGERGSVSEGEKKLRKGDVFPAWRREDISRVELAYATGPKLVLERIASGDAGDTAWKMASPVDVIADPDQVEKLLGQLEFSSVVRKVPDGARGLDEPRVRGTIAMGRVTYAFALGAPAETPAGSAYFRLNADPPIVVGRELVDELLRGGDAYRSRTIVPYLSIELAKISIANAEGTIAIHRENETSFRFDDSGLRVSREALDIVWKALAETRAESFLADADADRALGAPLITVTMTPKDNRPASEIVIGGACPGHVEDAVVVRKTPTRLSACVARGVVDSLGIKSKALADRRLFAAHEDEISEMRFEPSAGGAASLDVARKGSGWHERAPVDVNLEGDAADSTNALVTAIAHGTGELLPRETPFTPRARVIAVAGEPGREQEEKIALGDRSPNGDTLVKREMDGAVVRVNATLARKLDARATELRPLRLFASSVEGREARHLSARCEGVTEDADRAGGTWKFETPKEFAIDHAAVIALVDAVERARALAWVADADDGTFGFGPACTIALTLEGDASPSAITLTLGAASDDGVYARINDDPAIAVVPASLRDFARTYLIDGHAFRVDVDRAAKITLTRGARTITLVPSDADAGKAADDLFAALARLRADRVEHLGAARPREGFASSSAITVTTVPLADAGAPPSRFTIAAPAGDELYRGRIDGVDATFVLSKTEAAAITKSLTDAGTP